jgi:hypothetical protein
MRSVDLPLHPGKCPKYLFPLMKQLSREMGNLIVAEYGAKELIRRFSDPMFFQAWGCAVAYDWQSSGLTTTTTAAIKEAEIEGLAVCGGKGKTSKKTISEIEQRGDEFGISSKSIERMQYSSRLAAKVDSSCILDGYNLYHHTFFFDEKGEWIVIQQGMNDQNGYARRYHWQKTDNFVDSPPDLIAGFKEKEVLSTVSKENEQVRKSSVDLINDNPIHLRRYLTGQTTLTTYDDNFVFPTHHEIIKEDLPEKDWRYLQQIYEYQPKNYEEMVSLKGMGGRKIRALALLSKLVHGTELDWKDPVKFSFAHGGKDGIPYPVDEPNYAHSIEFLKETVKQTKLGNEEKSSVLKRLCAIANQ